MVLNTIFNTISVVYRGGYFSLLAQLTPNIGSKATNKQKMDQPHIQTTIIIHKQTKRLFHNIRNVIPVMPPVLNSN